METTTLTTPGQQPADADLIDLFAPGSSESLASPTVFSALSRSRLARDLHDSVGQALFALLVEIRVALDRGQAGRDDLLILERAAQQAVDSVRAVAYRLRSRRSDDALGEARDYGERLQSALGRSLNWIDTRSNRRLGNRVARALAWCVREAVTNAVRHGAASTVEVRLRDSDGRIQITIRDDGTGFLPQAFGLGADGRGLGMLGCAERMAEVSGVFVVRSSPGEGTLVCLEAPRYLRAAPATTSTDQPLPTSTEHRPAAAAVAG